jgi:HPt (histidine-containing phosphotransfer) domain-containing protein
MKEATVYFSDLAQDPGLAEIVELFVAELPFRVEAMRQASSAGDLPTVGRLAHQLKGAGGSHGFPHLSTIAREVEHAARGLQSPSETTAAIERLSAACTQTHAGIPQPVAATSSGK